MNGEEVLLFDIGDACDRVHPLTEATNGKANIELLNQVPFDAVTIGNNEGIGNDKRQLDELYDDAEFPVVLANLYDPETDALPTGATISDQDFVQRSEGWDHRLDGTSLSQLCSERLGPEGIG